MLSSFQQAREVLSVRAGFAYGGVRFRIAGSADGGEPVCPAGYVGRENQQKPFKPVCERFVRWNRFRREIVEGERRLQKLFPGGHARRARL